MSEGRHDSWSLNTLENTLRDPVKRGSSPGILVPVEDSILLQFNPKMAVSRAITRVNVILLATPLNKMAAATCRLVTLDVTGRAVRRGGSRGALEPPFLRHKINTVPRIDFYTCQLTYFTFDSLKTTLLTSVKASLVKT